MPALNIDTKKDCKNRRLLADMQPLREKIYEKHLIPATKAILRQLFKRFSHAIVGIPTDDFTLNYSSIDHQQPLPLP